MTILNLSGEDREKARQAAIARVRQNRDLDRTPAHGAPTGLEGDRLHFIGCLGEIAVSKLFGLSWPPPLGDLGSHDVGGKAAAIEVRATKWATGNLILRPTDKTPKKLAGPWVLACLVDDWGEGVRVRLPGWIMGRDGFERRYRKPPEGGRPESWWIPQRDLLPMVALESVIFKRMIAERPL